jgi:membrane protease YdiL (CAAX protease family)
VDLLQTRDLAAHSQSSKDTSFRRFFVNEQGIRAGWSALMFAGIYIGLQLLQQKVLGHFMSLDVPHEIPPNLGILFEGLEVLTVFLATWIMSRIEKRSVFSYSFAGEHRAIRFFGGLIWGFVCLSALVGILWKAGFIAFSGFALSGSTAMKYALVWGFVFLLVGISEESTLRGYMQYTLTRGIGFWWAALLLSIVFATGHIGNSGENLLGILQVCVGGLLFCLGLYFTKSLFWSVGFHAGWDWAQSYFYGTPDSGLLMKGHLLISHPQGKTLWSGGSAGPEGSILLLPLVLVFSALMWLWWRKLRPAQ